MVDSLFLRPVGSSLVDRHTESLDFKSLFIRMMPKTKAAKLRAKLKRQVVKSLVAGTGSYVPVPGTRPRVLKKGAGKFTDWLKYIPRGIGGVSGLMTGGLSGARSGWDSGAELSKKIGWGAYGSMPVSDNGINFATPVPAIHTTDESCSISKTEYLGDVYTSAVAGQFFSRTFDFNPGVFLIWGSQLAQLFQEWRLDGAVVSFRSRSSSYTATTTLGTVMIAMDYNATNPDFTTKQQMQETSGSASCSIDQNCDCYIEADKAANVLKNLYVRTGSVPSGSDIHLYDLGKLQVATSGCAASANVGELYINYHITYTKPVVFPGASIDGAHYTLTSPSNTAYFGTSRTMVDDQIGLTFTDNNTILFPAGTYGNFSIQLRYVGTAATLALPTNTLTNLANTAGTLYGGNTWCVSPSVGTSSTNMLYVVSVYVVNPSGASSIALSGGTIPTAATQADLVITQISPALV